MTFVKIDHFKWAGYILSCFHWLSSVADISCSDKNSSLQHKCLDLRENRLKARSANNSIPQFTADRLVDGYLSGYILEANETIQSWMR